MITRWLSAICVVLAMLVVAKFLPTYQSRALAARDEQAAGGGSPRKAVAEEVAKARQQQAKLKAEIDALKQAVPSAPPAQKTGGVRLNMGYQGYADHKKIELSGRYKLLISKLGVSGDRLASVLNLLLEWNDKTAAIPAGETAADLRPKALEAFRIGLASFLDGERVQLAVTALSEPVAWAKMENIDERLRFEGESLEDRQMLPLVKLISAEIQAYPMPTDAAAVERGVQMKKQSNERIVAQAATWLADRQVRLLAEYLKDDLAVQRVMLHAAHRGVGVTGDMRGSR
jgi:hypothetical protein